MTAADKIRQAVIVTTRLGEEDFQDETVEGASSVSVDERGDLWLKTPDGVIAGVYRDGYWVSVVHKL